MCEACHELFEDDWIDLRMPDVCRDGRCAAGAHAAGWGTIKGKFVVDGTAPKLPAVDASKEAYCVEHHPINQSVVVDDKGNLANVVVFLRPARGGKVDVHPDYAAAERSAGRARQQRLLVPSAHLAGADRSAVHRQEFRSGRPQHEDQPREEREFQSDDSGQLRDCRSSSAVSKRSRCPWTAAFIRSCMASFW